jgi:hypothetical protein
MANKYLDGSLLTNKTAATPAPSTNKYTNGSLDPTHQQVPPVDKYQQWANDRLAEESAHGGDSYMPQVLNDMKRKFTQGASMGWYDDALAHVKSLGNPEEYKYQKALIDERNKLASDNTGMAGTAAEIAGSIVPGNAISGAVGRGVTSALAGNLISGGIAGAIQGTGDGKSLPEGVAEGLAGGAIGHGLGALAGRAASSLNPAPRVAPAPNAQALRDLAQENYRRFEQSGGRFSAHGIDDLRARVSTNLHNGANYVPNTDPTVEGLLNRVQQWSLPENAGNVRPVDMQWLSQAGGLSGDINPRQRGLGYNIHNTVEDWLTQASPENGMIQAGGNVDMGAKQTADRLWRQAGKAQVLERNIDKGIRGAAVSGSGGNETNKIRQAVNNTYNDLTKHNRQLSPDEEAAFRAAIHGSRTENLLRGVGKLRMGGGLSSALNIGGMIGTGGVSAVIPAAGSIAEHFANRIARRNADEVGRVIRGGGTRRTINPQASSLERFIETHRGNVGGASGAAFSQLKPAPVDGRR